MKKILIIFIALLLLPSVAMARTIFADNSIGDCTNGTYSPLNRDCNGGHGDSSYNSWDTIQESLNNLAVSGGDTLYVRSGTYRGSGAFYVPIADLTVLNADNTSWTYIFGYPTDNKPVLDCNNSKQKAIYSGDTAGGGTNDRAVDYVHIKHLEVKDCTDEAIDFFVSNWDGNNCDNGQCIGSHHITIEDVKTHGNRYSGIRIYGGHENVGGESHDILITKSEIYNNSTSAQHGVKLETGAGPGVTNHSHIYDTVLSYNKVYNNTGSGNNGGGLKSSNGCYNITFAYNFVYGNGGPGIWLDGTWNSEIYGNVLYGNGTTSGNRHEIAIGTSTSTGNVVYNNTINHSYNSACSGGEPCSGIYVGVVDTVVKNNIMYLSSSANYNDAIVVANSAISGYDAGAIDYNLYHATNRSTYLNWGGTEYNFTNWKSASNQDANSINDNPDFTNVGSNVYTLQDVSPAVDAGIGVGINTDIDGKSIPQGSGYDIGSYEYVPGGGQAPDAPTGLAIIP